MKWKKIIEDFFGKKQDRPTSHGVVYAKKKDF